MIKRGFDIICSVCGLAVLSPLLFCIACMIKIDDGGSVFYRGRRVGLMKKPFRIIKFRTMVMNAESVGGPSTADDDPRITRVGRVLRRYKLDELPQLINVLLGEMSFVGPRPEVKSEVDRYDPEWNVIFSVRPGITDLSSIAFRNEGEIIATSGIRDAHEAYRRIIQPQKLELQRKYALNHSFLLDIRIIFQTFLAVAGKHENDRE